MLYHTLLALICLLLPGTYANVYEHIGQQLLQNYPVVYSSDDTESEPADKKTRILTDFEAYSSLLSIMSSGASETDLPSTLTQESMSELSLFFHKQEKPDHTVLERVFRGKTMLGKIACAYKLATPTDNHALLTSRQNSIRWLLGHTEQTEQLRELFSSFSSHEKELYSLWNPTDFLYSRMVENEFFRGSFDRWRGPSGAIWLEGARRFSDVMVVGGPLLISSAMKIAGKAIQKVMSSLEVPQDRIHQAEKIFDIYCPLHTAIQTKTTPSPGRLIFSGAMIALVAYSSYQWVVMKYVKVKNRLSLARHIRQRIQSLVHLHTLITSLYQFLQDHPTFAQTMPESIAITSYIEDKNSEHRAFIESLRSPAFQSDSYLFSNIGKVLHVIPELLRLKSTFTTIFDAIGSFDTYVGTAQLYEEMRTEPATFCFPEYQHSPHPRIAMNAFWHPLLPAQHVVTNDITLGGATQKDAVITGANSSGKTIAIKAIGLNLLLGQTLGIAPSSHCSFTPFARIMTYLRVADNLSKDQSLFIAEADRAEALLSTLTSLSSQEKAFCIMDEIFKSTGSNEGEGIAFGLTYALTRMPHAMTFLATHFFKLTTLPRHTALVAQNYHIPVIYDKAHDTYIRPYRLEKGRSHQVIALDLMRQEGFDPEILAHANRFLEANHSDHLGNIRSITIDNAQDPK